MLFSIRLDGISSTLEADNIADACAQAEALARERNQVELRTVLARVDIEGDGQQISLAIQFDPPEPPCPAATSHDWQSPVEVVGGLDASPGTYTYEHGQLTNECCLHCGCRKTVNTWDLDDKPMIFIEFDPGYYIEQLN